MAVPAGSTVAGGCAPGGGGGGSTVITSGDGSISVVEAPAGTFNITASAASVGADPAGTAAAAVAAHEASVPPVHVVAQVDGALDSTGDTMSGVLDMDGNNIAMGGGNISAAATVAATNAVNAPLHSGVPLTAAGSATEYLSAGGTYTTPSDESVLTWEWSDVGNRGPGAPLRSGGDRFGGTTPGQAQGAAVSVASTLEQLAWNCTVNNVGAGAAVEVTIIRASSVISTQDVVIDAPLQGVVSIAPPIAALAGDSIYVGWSSSNAGPGTRTVQNLDVTITGTAT